VTGEAVKTKAPHLALAVVLASGASAHGALAATQPDRPVRGAVAGGESSSSLLVSGHVTGLYPGASKLMRVSVRNGLGHAVELRWVRATVLDAGPECSRENLVAQPNRQHVPIEPHRTRALRLRISMRSRASNACQGATFPLRFRAQAAVESEVSGAQGGEGDAGGGAPGRGADRAGGTTNGGGGGGNGLPFTGLELAVMALAAMALLGAGITLRRLSDSPRRGR
jgi:hypothetical protein